MTKEGESRMPEKENPFEKIKDDARDLFADESDIFGKELKKPHAENSEKLPQEEQHDGFSEDEADLSYGQEKPESPVRRILLIAATIVVGIGLGVGGYLFFTAGSKKEPVEIKVAKVLPDPVPMPAPAVMPSEKPMVIPEIPVKSEPQQSETAQAKEAKPQESLPKSETKEAPVQKAEAGNPKKEATSASAAKPEEEKKLLLPKESSAAVKGKGAYYVQAGLFENEQNADAVAQKIRQKGFTPMIKKTTNAQQKTFYRVTVGSYSSFKKAAEVSEALGRQGITAIVRKQ
jgi:cell division septation protein DedD